MTLNENRLFTASQVADLIEQYQPTSAEQVLYQLEADIRSIVEVDDRNKAYRNMIIGMIQKARKKGCQQVLGA